ncbi:MAG: hypothetical protein HKP30_13460 [Myxococcales bacterium]|nr:hypothetical protein [Myxococcales bacterium]
MTHDDYLLTLAELSVTFAGLAAIVTVLRSPRIRVWSPREMVGLWGLLAPCLAVFMLTLVPAPLLSMGVSAGAVWRGASAVIAVGWLLGGGKAVLVLRRAAARGYPDPTPFSNPLLLLLGGASCVVGAVNAVGLVEAQLEFFILSLLSSLAFSVAIFATFLYASTSASRKDRAAARARAEGDGA